MIMLYLDTLPKNKEECKLFFEKIRIFFKIKLNYNKKVKKYVVSYPVYGV